MIQLTDVNLKCIEWERNVSLSLSLLTFESKKSVDISSFDQKKTFKICLKWTIHLHETGRQPIEIMIDFPPICRVTLIHTFIILLGSSLSLAEAVPCRPTIINLTTRTLSLLFSASYTLCNIFSRIKTFFTYYDFYVCFNLNKV